MATFQFQGMEEVQGAKRGANHYDHAKRSCRVRHNSSAGGTFLKDIPFLLSILIIDECGCAKPQDIAIAMMDLRSKLKRTILAGDQSQLSPPIFSDMAKNIWSKTLFEELIERGCKITRLNIEYSSHSWLTNRPVSFSTKAPSAHIMMLFWMSK